ncbi:MAG: hypothetical protein AAF206_00360 [Bacteroidota bacterium]
MTTYQIHPDRSGQYAIRKALRMTMMFLAVFAAMMLLIWGMAKGNGDVFKYLIAKFHWFLMIIAYMFGMMWFRMNNMAKAMRFVVEANQVSLVHNKADLNVINQFAQARNKSRYGMKPDKSIAYRNILSISINDDRIRIRDKDFNWLNSNGEIVIPEEVEGFEQLKQHFNNLRQ